MLRNIACALRVVVVVVKRDSVLSSSLPFCCGGITLCLCRQTGGSCIPNKTMIRAVGRFLPPPSTRALEIKRGLPVDSVGHRKRKRYLYERRSRARPTGGDRCLMFHVLLYALFFFKTEYTVMCSLVFQLKKNAIVFPVLRCLNL